MDLFSCFFAMSSVFYDDWSSDFDIVGSLPLEVAIIILRLLDPKSLVNATRVSSRWLNIIKSDRVLRRTVREEMARQKAEKLKKDMFLSKCVADHFGMLSKARNICKPYPDRKKPKFEKSLKTVEGKKPTRKMMNWVSSVSSSTLRKFR